jgi:hypothetical protein
MNMKQTPGVRVAEPKSKTDAWAIKVSAAKFWAAFELEVASMNFVTFMRRLKDEKTAALEDAQALVEKYTPKMAEALKCSRDTAWFDPLLKPEWHDTLRARVTGALVKDDTPVMVGKLPVLPKDFPIDPEQRKKADDHVKEWKAALKRQGVDEYESSLTNAPVLLPLCPVMKAKIRCDCIRVNIMALFSL